MTEDVNATVLPEEDEGIFVSRGISPDTIPAIVISLFILLTNGGVIVLIICHSHLKTTSNFVFVSLAMSDFLMGLIGIPLVVACTATFLSPACISSVVFTTFISLTTAGNITMMTCDRYIYICCALRYTELVTKARVIVSLCVTWAACLIVSLARLAWIVNVKMEDAKKYLELKKKNEMIYFSFNFIAFFFVPLLIMAILDIHMLLVVRAQCRRIKRENFPVEVLDCYAEKRLKGRHKRAVFTCILLLVLYVLFWLPYFVLEFAQQTTNDPLGLPEPASLTIYYLRFCTSLLNPVIYTLRKPDLKKAVRSLVGRSRRLPRKKTSCDEVSGQQIALRNRRNTENIFLSNDTETD